MPATASDARRLMDAKLSIPGELRTAEWRRLPQWLRERAFYMAGVHQAEILDRFRGEAAALAQGETSIPQAERRLSEYLEAAGYRPAPGQEGTIKDLRSWRRMRVALRTNKVLLQGWAQKERGRQRGALLAFPAWELVRYEPARVPRDWQTRWALAGGTLSAGRMIALKDSDVWAELGSFEDGLGVDYPPFAWGSGMGWKAVSRREAKRLGILPEGWAPPAPEPVASPNAGLEMKPRVADRALRDELARRMRGLAEWREDTFVFTDPNGSRPYPAEKVAEVIAAELPPGFRNLSAEAVQAWFEDSMAINLRRGRDVVDDFARAVARIEPMRGDRPVWRGEKFAREADLLERLESLLAGTPVREAAQSWSRLPTVAEAFARREGLPYRLVLHSRRHSSLRFIQPLAKKIYPKYWKQAEALSLEGSRWKAAGEPVMVRAGRALEIHLEVEEL